MTHTLVAMQTGFDLFHFFLPMLGEPALGRSSSEHQRHSGTVVDLDTLRTRHTVATASAEIA